LRQLERPHNGQREGVLRPRDRRIQVANKVSDVVKIAQQRRRA
jgi:hypothetical protein